MSVCPLPCPPITTPIYFESVRRTGNRLLTEEMEQDLEQECMKPEKSHVLSEIGLSLLKFVSSHRGLS